MKTKKRGIIVLAVLIVIAALIFAICSPAVHTRLGNIGVNGLTGKDLQNVDSVVLISHCKQIEGRSNSVAGVKEAVRLGADGVCVDLCFRKDGTPVITDNYADVDSAQTVEELFKAVTEEKFNNVRIYFNIVQLSDLSELNRLAVQYDIVSRLTLLGIDPAHYGLITNDDTIVPFYLNYDVTADDISAIGNGTFSIPEVLSKYGASGLVIDRSDCNEKVMNTFADYGIPVIVSGISSGSQMCQALVNNAGAVLVGNIENCAEIFDGWVVNMQKRYESSVEQSLRELSTYKETE